ncbi:MAG: hypothetical protein KDD44_15110, partial [Bdellovibrionales bacterium]|nr:hypothetical protein [Bdellovibrionales bacterium]
RSKRLVNDDVVALLWRRLRSGGWLSFKTDHEDYFEQVQKLTMLATGFQVVFESRDLHRDPAAPEHFESEFEKMFKAQAQPVFYLLARKLQKHEGEVAVLKD